MGFCSPATSKTVCDTTASFALQGQAIAGEGRLLRATPATSVATSDRKRDATRGAEASDRQRGVRYYS